MTVISRVPLYVCREETTAATQHSMRYPIPNQGHQRARMDITVLSLCNLIIYHDGEGVNKSSYRIRTFCSLAC